MNSYDDIAAAVEMIARHLGQWDDLGPLDDLVEHLCITLQEEDRFFNRAQFLQACGYFYEGKV